MAARAQHLLRGMLQAASTSSRPLHSSAAVGLPTVRRGTRTAMSLSEKTSTGDTVSWGTTGERVAELSGEAFRSRMAHHFPTLETLKTVMADGQTYEELPIVLIRCSKNNTKLGFTTHDGEPICYTSSTQEGFKNAKKKTMVAGQATGVAGALRALRRGVRSVRVVVKGLGPGRMASVKGLVLGGLNVVSITDVTPLPGQRNNSPETALCWRSATSRRPGPPPPPPTSTFDVAAAWASLPPELQAAVIAKLPFKQRVRATSVCKAWAQWLELPQHWKDGRRLVLDLRSCKGEAVDEMEPFVLDLRCLAESWGTNFFEDCLRLSLAEVQARIKLIGEEVLPRLKAALSFLALRCPLRTLEFYQTDFNSRWNEHLLVVAAAPMELQTLIIHEYGCPWGEDVQALLALLQSQPKLQTLVLLNGFHSDMGSAEVLRALEQLKELRLLVVMDMPRLFVSEIPASVLRRLDCLSFLYGFFHYDGETTSGRKAAAEAELKCVQESAPGLQFQYSEYRDDLMKSRRFALVTWAKEGFPVATAMADKGLYPRNYLVVGDIDCPLIDAVDE